MVNKLVHLDADSERIFFKVQTQLIISYQY